MADWQHRFVQVRGARWHVVTAGQGPLVVLLHGFPQTWYCWRHVIDALSQGHTVAAPDLKGFGESDVPAGPYHLKALSRDLRSLILALGYERAAVVGHDWGGAVALQFALDHPGMLTRLGVLNATIFDFRFDKFWYQLVFNIPWLPEWYFRYWGNYFITRGLQQLAYDPATFDAATLRVYQQAFRRPGRHRGSLAYYRALPANARIVERNADARIERPTLVLWGMNDPILVPEFLPNLLAHLTDAQVVCLDQCGHWVAEERPAEVREALVAFLGEG